MLKIIFVYSTTQITCNEILPIKISKVKSLDIMHKYHRDLCDKIKFKSKVIWNKNMLYYVSIKNRENLKHKSVKIV